LADGQDVHRVDNDASARLKWIFEPDDLTIIKLILDYAHRDGTMGLNFRPTPGTQPLLPGYQQGSSQWDIDNARAGDLRIDGGGVGLTIEHDLGFARLMSMTSYRDYSSFTDFSPSLVPQLGQVIDISRTGNQQTEELQLVSEASSKLKWVIGAFGIRSEESAKPLAINLVGPLARTPASLSVIDINTNAVAKSIATFGQVTYEALPQTNVTGGLRYTYEDRSFNGGETGMLNNGVNLGAFPIPSLPPSISFQNVSYRFSIDHFLSPSTMIYASDNRGFKSGGYNGLDPTNPPYLPEQLDAYEVGIKSEQFDKHVRLNLAGFYYDYQNIQVSRYLETSTIYNGGARLYGLDFDFAARLGAFSLFGGLEYLNNRFTSFPNAQFSIPQPSGGDLITSGNAAGNHLPFASTFSGNIGLTYIKTMTGGALLTFAINDYHNSGYSLEPDNIVKQPAYDLLGSSVEWQTSDGNYAVRLWATNLLNKPVIGFIASPNLGSQIDYSNAPRSFGATITARFGQ